MAYEDFNGESSTHYYDGEPRTYNNFLLGFIIFLALPIITLFAMVALSGALTNPTVQEIAKLIWQSNSPVIKIMFVGSFLPTLIAFFVVYKQERWKMAYGAATATLFYFFLFLVHSL